MPAARSRIFPVVAFAATSLILFSPAAHAQGEPGIDKNTCLSGKTKCVSKKVAGLLKCREQCQKNPKRCGAAEIECEEKVLARFDGGDAPEKSCFAKLEAKQKSDKPSTLCTTVGDVEAMAAEAEAAARVLLAALEGVPLPVCGNGIRDGEEQCDGSDLDGADCSALGDGSLVGPLGCTPGCAFDSSACGAPKRVFVSSQRTNGDLGGLSGGDAFCQSLADAAGLGGSWTAWLSDSTGNARDRIADHAYYLVDEVTLVEAGIAGLTDGGLLHPIDQTEVGSSPEVSGVWTGTRPTGVAAGATCLGWSTAGVVTRRSGNHGRSTENDSNWTAATTDLCTNFYHVYCFEN